MAVSVESGYPERYTTDDMRFFRKRFTEEQKGTLQRIAGALNCIGRKQEAEFSTLVVEMAEFVRNCADGQRAGLGRPLNPPKDREIKRVREALLSHTTTIESSRSRLKEIVIPDWAPSKFVEARQDMDKFYDTHVQFLKTALRGLAPPDPLVDQLGEAKLNMFLSGLSLARRMIQHHPLKA